MNDHTTLSTQASGDLSGVEDLVSLFTKQEADNVTAPGSVTDPSKSGGDTGDLAKPPASTSQTEPKEPATSGELPDKAADPLASLDIPKLLEHKDLGPQLQRWADQSAAAQVRSALDRERSRLQTEASSKAEEDALRDYFSNLSQEELGRVLASDPDLAASYARIQQNGRQTTADPTEVMTTAKTIAFGTIIHDTNTRAETAGVDLKGELSPQKFTQYGDEGLNMWVAKVNEAIVRSAVEKEVNASIETRYQAFVEEQAAKGEGTRIRPTTPGRNSAIEPDLMETSSREYLEYALETQGNRNGARQ